MNHFEDDAVWRSTTLPQTDWAELRDPSSQSLDLAFVITPEPATLTLLVLGVLAMIRRRGWARD